MASNKETELDLKIKQKLALIAEKKEEIKKVEKYKFITNMVIVIDGTTTNLNVLTIDQLAEMAYKVAKVDEVRRLGYELIELDVPKDETVINGYPVSDWLEDIKSAVKRKNISNEKAKLSQVEKELEKLYSENAKRENKINDLLNGLDF